MWQPLGPRECAILKAVVEGLTNPQIADLLHIPQSTVKYVIRRLFEKVGVRSVYKKEYRRQYASYFTHENCTG